ncbi:MAG: preprotein translocase subunit SecG [Lachnospiraceae bacterium]|nr:preprotein translocase subunit SecG [Lachnospiraceae bacterium]
MNLFYLIATIIVSIVSVIMIIVVCLQEGKSAGLSSAISGGSETYWSKNKGRSKEGRLEKITIIVTVIFFVAAILLNVGLFTKM